MGSRAASQWQKGGEMRAEVVPATGGAPGRPSPTVWRMRNVTICILLTALAFLQEPGLTLADTKVDLVVNPVGWLDRALHLWNPSGNFGQLQNQAYGYLWPMGPFFAVGSSLGLSAWVIQRLWWALVLCVAFTGVVKLAGRLAIGTEPARLIAGLAFALSPRILTDLGLISIEVWPMAIAPWVLVPLIGLAHGARLRPAVARSAIAVACAGGVNATAVFAVVPLALLWLAMLQPLRRRLAALGAWSLAVLCATAWWLGPLFLLGRYSPTFLDYIENAEVTTKLTDVVTNLRGASQWLAYLGGPYGPILPAGSRLATDRVLVVATIVVATFGVVGLSRRAMPHRRFLIIGLVVGVALVGIGHIGAVDGALAGPQREFLDGAGSPLRNVHKFDVVLRLPLVLGLAHMMGMLGRLAAIARNGFRPARPRVTLAIGLALAGIAAVASPALAGGLAVPGGYKEVPGYWHEATDWLDAHLGRDRVLVVPAARFPDYEWGSTVEEITQPLLDGSWAVRNSIPMTPPTTIRLLDAVESALSTGAGSPGLANVLARSGVRYLLIRSDLDYGRSGSARPLIVRQALERSPGLSFVTGFGPILGGNKADGAFVDNGLDVPVRALEVFRVDIPADPVVAFDIDDVTTVVGGPESLLDLASAGQLTAAPTVLSGDLRGRSAPGRVALTDGLRRRDVAFGQLRDNTSATMTADEAFDTPVPAHDYLPAWAAAQMTTVRYRGIRGVDAKSSWAQPRTFGGGRPEHQAFAAIDGDFTTSWRPALGAKAAGQWLEVQLEDPQKIRQVRVHFDLAAGAVPTKLTVTAGVERASVEAFSATADVVLPGVHATRTIRVTVDEVVGLAGGSGFGISEIDIPDVHAERTLAIPASPVATEPASVVLTAAPGIPSCFFVDNHPRCAPSVARGSEDGNRIDRTLTLPAAGAYQPTVWARPRPGPELDAVLDHEIAVSSPLGLAPTVTASSTGVADPTGRPGAVIDGDPATTWTPASSDTSPVLHIGWLAQRTITGLRLTLDPQIAATRPGVIRAVGDDGVRGGFLSADGVVVFDPPMQTDEITIMFLDEPTARSYDPYGNHTEVLPIGVGEITALPDPANSRLDLDRRVTLPCGSGPIVEVGGLRLDTRLSATRRDLLEMRETVAQPCTKGDDPRLGLSAGKLRVIASGTAVTTPTRLALVPDRPPTSPVATAVRIDTWSATERHIQVDVHPTERILAVRENINAGWQASAAGHVLTPIVVDGWQQGWLLPAGLHGEIVLRFTPDAPYRAGLLGGAIVLVGVLLLALIPVRRRGSHAPRSRDTDRAPARALSFVVGGVSLILVGGVVGGAVTLVGLIVAAYQAQVVPRSGGSRRNVRRVSRWLQAWLPAALLLIGGWLSLTVEDSHRAAGPQVAGLLAVGGLWLSVVAASVTRPASTPPLQGALHDVVADSGEGQPTRESHQVRAHQVTGEDGSVVDEVERFEHEGMPQKEPVRDRA
jgi:arabinofuranan 3-O-arabinosyltransferase